MKVSKKGINSKLTFKVDFKTGKILNASPAALHYLGKNLTDIKQLTHTQIINSKKKISHKKIVKKAEREDNFIIKNLFLKKDKEKIPVEIEFHKKTERGRSILNAVITPCSAAKPGLNKETSLNIFEALDHFEEIIITTDINFNVTYSNKASEALLAMKKEEAKGKNFEEVFNIRGREINRGQLREIIKENECWNGEIIVCINGKEKVYHLSTAHLKENEHLSGYSIIIYDLSRSKNLENEIKRNEEKFRRLFHSSPDAMCIYRFNDEIITDLNKSFSSMTGINPEDLSSSEIFKTLTWIRQKDYDLFRKKLSAEENKIGMEASFLTNKGKFINSIISATKVEINNEEYVIFILRDISIFKQIMAANTAILSAIPDMIFRFKLDGTFIDYNAPNQQDLIASPHLFLGKKISEVVEKDIADKTLEAIDNLLKTGEIQIYEYESIVNNSKRFWESRMILCGEDEILSIVRDVTQKKISESRLSKLNACFLNFGSDPDKNISYLVKLCGEIMDSPAMYNCISNDDLITRSISEELHGFIYESKAKGHICTDLINIDPRNPLIITNLRNTKYFKTDPIVSRYNLKTYIGLPVHWNNRAIGSLCIVSSNDLQPTPEELNFLHIIASGISIEEERKKTGEILQESEERYRKLVEAAPIGIAIHSEGIIDFVNAAGAQILGYNSPDDLIGKSVKSLIHPDSIFQVMDRIQRMSDGEEVPVVIEKYLKSDGTVIEGETSAIPFTFQNKKAVQVIVRDVTEQNKAQKIIYENEKRYRTLFDLSPSGIMLEDINGIILDVNSALCKTFGYVREELIGKNVRTLVPLHRRKEVDEHIKLIFENKKLEHEVQNIRKDGSLCYMELRETLITLNDGSKGILVVSNDITEKIISQRALIQRDQTLEVLNLFAGKLLRTGSWKDNIQGMLQQLGKAAGVSRAYIFSLFHKNNDSLILNHILEWTDEEVPALINNPVFKNMDYNKLNTLRIQKVIIDKNVYHSLTKHLPIALGKMFMENGIKSIIITGIFVKEKPWGILGFDDCSTERNWSSLEIDMLKTAAEIIGSAIEREQMEEELEEKREQYRNLFENAPIGIYRSTPDGNIILANETMVRMLGFTSLEDLQQHNLNDENYLPSYPRKIFQQLIEKNGFIKDFEAPWIQGNKRIIYLRENAKAVKDKQGNTIYYEGIVEDVTEKKLAEEELVIQRIKYKQLFENSPLGIVLLDTNEQILSINKGFEQMFLVTDNCIGKYLNDIIVPDEFRTEATSLSNAALKGKTVLKEGVRKRKDGTLVDVIIYGVPLSVEDKNVGVFGIYSDITERKNYEKELKQAKEYAEEMSRIKSNFLANMSHELRTPMSAILGYAEILQLELSDETLKDMASTIHLSGTRLLDTLNMILNLSKLEANKFDVMISEVNIISIIKEIVKLFKVPAQTRNLYLRTKIEYDTLMVKADERILYEIMNNLVNNAIKFTLKGGITIELYEESNWVVIKVHDTGIGIPKENLNLIFEEFRQVSEGLNRGFEGTGLGLTLTKRFVEILNGEISVESSVGSGSTFIVKLPNEKKRLPSGKTLSEDLKNELKSDKILKKRPKVLIVENDKTNQQVISIFIKDNCELDTADTAETAIIKAKEKYFDIILMDINLGKGMSGIDATKIMRKIPGYENTPIVAVTAFAMKGDKEEFLAAGCSHYLAKPFDKKTLEGLISKILKEQEK